MSGDSGQFGKCLRSRASGWSNGDGRCFLRSACSDTHTHTHTNAGSGANSITFHALRLTHSVEIGSDRESRSLPILRAAAPAGALSLLSDKKLLTPKSIRAIVSLTSQVSGWPSSLRLSHSPEASRGWKQAVENEDAVAIRVATYSVSLPRPGSIAANLAPSIFLETKRQTPGVALCAEEEFSAQLALTTL